MSQPSFIGGFDAVVHISEEARNANIAVPYGIFFATLSSVVLGWGTYLELILPSRYAYKDF
jgi:hypothetical protein